MWKLGFPKGALASLLVGGLCLGAAAPAVADNRDFTIVNESGANMLKLWISPSSSTDWEDEMLNGQIIRPGKRKTITFSSRYAQDECSFDLKYVDANHDSWTFNKIDLCRMSELTFTRQGERVLGSWK